MSDEQTKKYEAVIVLNTQGEDGIDELISNIGKEMENEGVKLDRIDRIGKRDFAYNARKQPSGFYVNYFFAAAPSKIKKLRTHFDLNKKVYMQHYQLASS